MEFCSGEPLFLSLSLFVLFADWRGISMAINKSFPGTIDERVLNTQENMNVSDIIENFNLCINSARTLGSNIALNIDDIIEGNYKDYFLLQLVWTVIEVL
jgi:hypothetical protein